MTDAHLPPPAVAVLTRIEALLREAEPLLNSSETTADLYALRETKRTYLPQTITTYLNVPVSLRDQPDATGESAQSRLLAALGTIENATRTYLERAAQTQRDALAVQQRFLSDRFADIPPQDPALALSEAQTEVPPARPSETMTTALFTRFFDPATLVPEDPRALLEALATRLLTVFAPLTHVRRALLSRTITEITIEVPVANGTIRYALIPERTGLVASVARIVGGVSLRHDTPAIEVWLAALAEHLEEYAASRAQVAQDLRRFFSL